MYTDNLSDEALLEVCLLGKTEECRKSIDILCQRYYKQIYYYLLKESLIKDSAFIEDIRQDVFLLVCRQLQKGQFTPLGAGSFRAWFYTIAQNICRTKNRQRSRYPVNLFGMALDLMQTKSPEDKQHPDYTQKTNKIIEILLSLSDDEQQLLRLTSEGKSYKEILQFEMFKKYSLAYLKLKIYNTRQKLKKLLKEQYYDKQK